MRKHNQIHTLGAPHCKAHFRFLRKLKDFKCVLWSKKYGSCPDLFAVTAHAKSCERMLRHRAVYGDNCGVVRVLRICGLLDEIGGLRILRKITENLR